MHALVALVFTLSLIAGCSDSVGSAERGALPVQMASFQSEGTGSGGVLVGEKKKSAPEDEKKEEAGWLAG